MYRFLYSVLSRFPILVFVKKRIDEVELAFFSLLQMCRVIYRSIVPKKGKGKKFALLCVKRIAYVDLAIRNSNSLHYYNPHHKVTFFVDPICGDYLSTQMHRLHYPKQCSVQIYEHFSQQPWQLSKIEAIFIGVKDGMIFIDADSVWRSKLEILDDYVYFLVKAYAFVENRQEKEVLSVLGKKSGKNNPIHFVSGFFYLPLKLYSKRLEADCMRYCKSILALPNVPQGIVRLSEEIALSLAVQEHIARWKIKTLKKTDGPGDTNIVQSYYYGCANGITT